MWFVYMIGTLLAFIVLVLALKKKPTPRFPLWQPPRFDGDLGDRNTSFDAMRNRFRDGPTLAWPKADLDEPFKRAEENVRKHPPVEAKSHPRPTKSPALGFQYGRKQPVIALTPRDLERVNIQRRLAGRPPLNRAGFSNAVAHAWDQPRRQPDTTQNWLTYLILYQVFSTDHQSPRVAVDQGITISPDQPYNGHGGEFAGAGASGSWDSPAAAAATGAAGIAAGIAGIDNYTASEPSAQPASAPGLSPGSSAPDPTPPSYSPSADSGYSAPADTGGGFGGGDGS